MHSHTQIAPQRRLTRIKALGIAGTFALVLAALFAPASPALAHDQLVNTVVVTDESGATEAVRMTFSNNVLEMGTEVLITDAADADVTSGEPEVSGPDVTQAVTPGLPDGTYNAVWRVVSSDGHPIEGGFSFHIENGAPGEIEVLPEGDGHDHGDESGDAEADHDHGDEDHSHEGDAHGDHDAVTTGGEDSSTDWILPVGIAAAVLVIAAIVIPLLTRKRKKSAAPTDSAPSAWPSDSEG
ncbi:copper resistance protein CopC [Leucobacter denitrificans]|uniref:Copper resistance protein CopC n=1 Tax=Leucobacter denitrificans TaxID=683042 RepID=A0A7G9S4U2_9MICO|nr:copper resistance protein CopC [Leucobacter denitrificans]QNN62867.1 copper resistance protein CopC [Leucobacter denitrificans]